MRYDMLADFRNYLCCEVKLSNETVRTYCERIDKLIDTQNINHLDISRLVDKMTDIKYKNYFSQSKNALFYFLTFQHITLTNVDKQRIELLEKNLHKKYRKLKHVNFNEVSRKIKYIRNKRLKISYMIMIELGLRVSEVAQIRKKDCELEEDTIKLSFVAYGRNKEQVILYCEGHEKLFHDLQELISSADDNKRIFYSANYLQQKAKKLGFTCSDLRKACAKIEYKNTKSKESVQKKMRHKTMKSTNICLRSKIKI